MDSRAVASALNTDPKTLRRFLRSDASSVIPVGSGGRYVFQASDMTTMREEFSTWVATDRKPRPTTPVVPRERVRRVPANRDQAVWDEEREMRIKAKLDPDVFLPPLSDPRVLAEVRATADRQEMHLMELVRRAGLTTNSRSSARV